MRHDIYIKRNELQQQVDLKTYYLGEAVKRKDADADTLQSSKDEKELFVMFTKRALNELTAAVALRFSSIDYRISEKHIEISFCNTKDNRKHLLPQLKQAIIDYLANEITMHWLLMRYPTAAQPYIAQSTSLHSNVQQMLAKFYNSTHVRRRSTYLAGI